MRRLLTCALALLLLTAGLLPCARAEQGYVAYDYTPTLINRMGLTAQEWVSSSDYRALGTILVVYDMMATLGADSDRTPDLIQTSYVGLDGGNVMFYLRAEKQDLLVRYTPADGTGDYTTFQPLDDATAASSMENICPNGSYTNDLLSIVAIIEHMRERVAQGPGQAE